jgi:farnesyl-diphosphate farnesyltransferase
MKAIQDEKIFRFCAIPQLMAIATLCKLYDNKDVLAKNVKIHKGRTARYFMSKQNYQRVKNTYITLLESLYQKSNSPKIKQLINQINQK